MCSRIDAGPMVGTNRLLGRIHWMRAEPISQAYGRSPLLTSQDTPQKDQMPLPEEVGDKGTGVVGDEAFGFADAHACGFAVDQPGAEDRGFAGVVRH